MRVNARSRYAVTAMADLAVFGTSCPVSLAEIAERRSMPLPYLEQLFAQLRRAGLVNSARGFQGGFTLSRSAESISLYDIISATDTAIKTTGCSGDDTTCNGTGSKCLTHDLWQRLGDHVRDFFMRTTLASIVGSSDIKAGINEILEQSEVSLTKVAS